MIKTAGFIAIGAAVLALAIQFGLLTNTVMRTGISGINMPAQFMVTLGIGFLYHVVVLGSIGFIGVALIAVDKKLSELQETVAGSSTIARRPTQPNSPPQQHQRPISNRPLQ